MCGLALLFEWGLITTDFSTHALNCFRLRVTTAAIDLLTNSRVAETSSPDVAVLPLLPFVLVRHLSDEFLQPARVVMSSQLAQSSALLKTMARGEHTFALLETKLLKTVVCEIRFQHCMLRLVAVSTTQVEVAKHKPSLHSYPPSAPNSWRVWL